MWPTRRFEDYVTVGGAHEENNNNLNKKQTSKKQNKTNKQTNKQLKTSVFWFFPWTPAVTNLS